MKESKQPEIAKVLKPFRKKIDSLDEKILKLLGDRFATVRKVANIKAKHGIPSFLHDRVEEVRNRCVTIGAQYGIDPHFLYSLYSAIIYESCATEDMIKTDLAKPPAAVKPKKKPKKK